MPFQPDYQHRLEALLTDLRAGASARDRTRDVPFELVERLRELRVGAVRLPRDQKGQGISLRELVDFIVALGAADPNVAHVTRNHYSFVELVRRATNPVIRQKWLPEVQAGKIFGLATAERGTKTADNSGLATRITREGGRYRIDGTKYYSTGTLYADFLRVSAVREDGTQITAVVPSDRAGIKRVDDWDGIGQRLSGSGTTVFENVAVEDDELLTRRPEDGNGHKYRGALPQLILNAVVAGIIGEIERDGAELVQKRTRTWVQAAAESPTEDPQVLAILGEISSYAFGARAVVLDAASALDAVDASVVGGAPDPAVDLQGGLAVSRSKVLLDSWGPRIANLVFDLAGASAVTRKANLDRHWRNIRTIISHNPAIYRARGVGAHLVSGTEPDV